VVLNVDSTLSSKSVASPLGLEVGEALARSMLRAVAAHINDAGRLEYGALRRSIEFAEALGHARRLVYVDVDDGHPREARLAFWINVYSALALHGAVALDVRRSVWWVWNFFGRVSYRVGPHVLSLDEIEHGILRGNRRRALPPWAPFGTRDARRALLIDPVDPRIHFAINCGAASCPPVGIYHVGAIDTQLRLATQNFVNQEIRLDARGRVSCSRLFRWYGRDFGSQSQLSNFLLQHLDDGPLRAALVAGAKPCQVYRAYSWALRHSPA
jgi:hypothetical protein